MKKEENKEESKLDLKNINQEYKLIKGTLEKKKVIAKKLEDKVEDIQEDIDICNIDIKKAQRNGDKVSEQTAKQKIQQCKQELKKVLEEAREAKRDVEFFRDKLDRIMDEIKENPQMKEHLEVCLAKRYDRAIKKIEKDKEDNDKEIEKLENVQNIINDHPVIGVHIEEIMKSNANIHALIGKLQTLDKVNDVDEIKKIKAQLKVEQKDVKQHKSAIKRYTDKAKIELKEEDLKTVLDKKLLIDGKTKEPDIGITISKSLQSAKRQRKSFDKTLNINQKALEKLDVKIPPKPVKEQKVNNEKAQLTEEKVKWWKHPILAFKQWNSKTDYKALPAPKNNGKDVKAQFADSLKYDVVKDVFAEMDKKAKTVEKEKEEER